jgi:signal transduction histidine kinase
VLLAKTLRSSTFRLALIAIGIFGAVVWALFAYVYGSAASYARSRSDHDIAAERRMLREAFDREGRDRLIATIAQRIAYEGDRGRVYLLADPSFIPVTGNLVAWPAALKGADQWISFSPVEWRPNGAKRPLLRAISETLPDGSHLLVGRAVEDLDAFVGNLRTAIGLSVVLVIVLAGLAAILVTRRTVGRIEAINATSRAIMASGLGSRIPLRGSRDEWDQLAENLNSMLERIEQLMAQVKQVTDNVAHDLRTPLTRMRGRLEQAYGRRRDADQDQVLIADTITELDRMLGTFSSLLRISQIETRERRATFRTVNLAEVAREVVSLFDAAAEENGGELETAAADDVLVFGDRDLLFEAVANLVDNAIRHGRRAGRVSVEVVPSGADAVISVADDGPGIPVNEREHVFKRFYRLERSRREPGNGLGLSLVAAVAQLHGARIEMADNQPGLRIRLRFPLATKSDLQDEGPIRPSPLIEAA